MTLKVANDRAVLPTHRDKKFPFARGTIQSLKKLSVLSGIRPGQKFLDFYFGTLVMAAKNTVASFTTSP